MKANRIQENFKAFELSDADYETITDLGKVPVRFGGIPSTFDPAWKVNVFNTPEEQASSLLEPF